MVPFAVGNRNKTCASGLIILDFFDISLNPCWFVKKASHSLPKLDDELRSLSAAVFYGEGPDSKWLLIDTRAAEGLGMPKSRYAVQAGV